MIFAIDPLRKLIGSPHQIALSLLALEWARGAAWGARAEAAALLESLGVVAVPELPARAARPALVVLPSQDHERVGMDHAR